MKKWGSRVEISHLIYAAISVPSNPACIFISQSIYFLQRRISFALDTLDVVDCSSEDHGFARFGLAHCQGSPVVVLGQGRDSASETLQFAVEAFAVFSFDLVVW